MYAKDVEIRVGLYARNCDDLIFSYSQIIHSLSHKKGEGVLETIKQATVQSFLRNFKQQSDKNIKNLTIFFLRFSISFL